ncbi:MAG: indolepyruvate ferredoxin oxidoreductase family protein, partial [Candidatus Lindowbacteria bacterium]|nr:indolepyruvate ferredoxin oxidoreductase family protein [Candidatus Lindowbacteria bacterium]
KTAAAVINNHDSPTADFTHNPDSPFPDQAMEQAISSAVGEAGGHFMDTTALGLALLGDALSGNMILLGYAWQKGLLPLQRDSLEQAIRLNGVAIEASLQAFLWGRRYAAHPERVSALAGLGPRPVDVMAAQSLDEVVDYRYKELTAYQNQAYAELYLTLVNKVREAEAKLLGLGERDGAELTLTDLSISDLALTEKVARYYFKLLAYKDEYEVARFYSNGEFQQSLAKQFDGKLRLRFHLAPPLLAKRDPDTGHLVKREFGAWMLTAFKLLAKFKFLRGTRFDPFGRTAERKMERQLITDYEQQINHLLDNLTKAKLAMAVELAGLPHFIRGYGHVKEANVNTVQRRAFNVMKKFDNEQLEVVNIHQPDVVHES